MPNISILREYLSGYVTFYDFIKKIFQITLEIVVMLVIASGLF